MGHGMLVGGCNDGVFGLCNIIIVNILGQYFFCSFFFWQYILGDMGLILLGFSVFLLFYLFPKNLVKLAQNSCKKTYQLT